KDYEITDIVYSYLDEQPKYKEDQIYIINSGQPDRLKIAQLIKKLDTAGAKVVGLDFFFEDLRGNHADTLLRESFQGNTSVVLACELLDIEQADERFEGIIGVAPFFAEPATLGYVNYPANETRTIRLFSPREKVGDTYQSAFTTAILQAYDPNIYAELLNRNREIEHIFFMGNKDDFARNDIDRVLDSTSVAELQEIMEGKIVLVGYAPEDIWANPLIDRHYTPLNKNYGSKAIPDMYGIVIHANVLSMVLNRNYVERAPKWLSYMLAVFFCYFNVLLIHWIYFKFHEAFHGITRALQVIEFIVLFFVIALLFYYFRIKIDFGIGILALLLAYDVIMIYESLIKGKIPYLANLPNYFEFNKKQNTPSEIQDAVLLNKKVPSNLPSEAGATEEE
ncbi:MAG: CHASE2 domain-containing protein, partial [Bacteroidota bacterium]